MKRTKSTSGNFRIEKQPTFVSLFNSQNELSSWPPLVLDNFRIEKDNWNPLYLWDNHWSHLYNFYMHMDGQWIPVELRQAVVPRWRLYRNYVAVTKFQQLNQV